MAHAATINTLSSNLVASITGLERSRREFNGIRDSVVKSFRGQSHARVNQFVVKERLDGLVEKFAVLNRDDLSEALQSRLDEISFQAKWIPDILSLLLELSDRPIEKSKLENLEPSRPPSPVRKLTWEEIIADDPFDDSDIWEDIERGYHSSGDEDFDDENSDPTLSTQASSLEAEDALSAAKSLLIKPDEELLQPIRQNTHIWRSAKRRNDPIIVHELVIVRQIIAMLRGLPTNLFSTDDETGEVTIARTVALTATNSATLSSLLRESSSLGSSLNHLRHWVSIPQRIAFMQSISSSVQSLLTNASLHLGQLEKSYMTFEQDVTVSCVEALESVKVFARPLERLSRLVKNTSQEQFAILDGLYEECCSAHIIGDQALLEVSMDIFLSGLETYLRTVSSWVETGTLPSKDKEISFVADADANCGVGNLWHDRFVLRNQSNGEVFAPKCIRHLTEEMFTLGKSRAFLNQLQMSPFENLDMLSTTTTSFSTDYFQPLQSLDSATTITPFDRLLSSALTRWLASSTNKDSTPQLLSTLLHGRAGFLTLLEAIPHIYFSSDSSLHSTFTSRLFPLLTSPAPPDTFQLTEIARTTLGQSSPSIDPTQLSLNLNPSSSPSSLSSLSLVYKLPAPLQNLTRTPDLPMHSEIFTLLLSLSSSRTHLLSFPANPQLKSLRFSLLAFLDTFQSHLLSRSRVLHSSLRENLVRAEEVGEAVGAWKEYAEELARLGLIGERFGVLRGAVEGILSLTRKVGEGSQPEEEDRKWDRDGYGRLREELESGVRFLVLGLRGMGRAGPSGTSGRGMGAGAGAGAGMEELGERLEGVMRVSF